MNLYCKPQHHPKELVSFTLSGASFGHFQGSVSCVLANRRLGSPCALPWLLPQDARPWLLQILPFELHTRGTGKVRSGVACPTDFRGALGSFFLSGREARAGPFEAPLERRASRASRPWLDFTWLCIYSCVSYPIDIENPFGNHACGRPPSTRAKGGSGPW
jgi:hypothetical protein